MSLFKFKKKTKKPNESLVERSSYPQKIEEEKVRPDYLEAEVINHKSKEPKALPHKDDKDYVAYKKIKEKDHTARNAVFAVIFVLLFFAALGILIYCKMTGKF